MNVPVSENRKTHLDLLALNIIDEPRQPYRKTARPYWRQNLCALEVYIHIGLRIGLQKGLHQGQAKRLGVLQTSLLFMILLSLDSLSLDQSDSDISYHQCKQVTYRSDSDI